MIEEIRKRLSRGGWLILLHANADVDAVSSAAVIALTYPSCAITAPAGINREAKRLAAMLGLGVDEVELKMLPGKVVVIDTASPEMLPGVTIPPDSLVIDHHAPVDGWGTQYYFSDPTKTSCAEVAIEIVRPKGISKEAARAALFGIFADTGAFRHSNAGSLKAFAELVEISGTSPEEVFEFFSDIPDDISVRIARLKGAQRMRFQREGNFIIGASQVGAHEADVCKAMLHLGCDIAFVGRKEEADFRLSSRAKQHAVEAGIDLDKIMRKVAEQLGWQGGGHPAAAGMGGKGDAEAATNFCMQTAVETLASAEKSK